MCVVDLFIIKGYGG